jgi:hypothetical protein
MADASLAVCNCKCSEVAEEHHESCTCRCPDCEDEDDDQATEETPRRISGATASDGDDRLTRSAMDQITFTLALDRTRAFHLDLLAQLQVHSPNIDTAAWLDAAACSDAGRAHLEADGLGFVPPDGACANYQPVQSCVDQVQLTHFPVAYLDLLPEQYCVCLPGRSWKGLRLECAEGCCAGTLYGSCYNMLVLRNRFCAHVVVAPCVSSSGVIHGYGMFAEQALSAGGLHATECTVLMSVAGAFVGEYKGRVSSYEAWVEHIEKVKRDEYDQETAWPYIPHELYGMSISTDGVDFLVDGFECGSAVRSRCLWCRPLPVV